MILLTWFCVFSLQVGGIQWLIGPSGWPGWESISSLMERWIVGWWKPSRCASFFQLVGELIALRAMTLFGSPASTFFEDTKNMVNYQLALLFFQLSLHLRFLLSFLAAKLFSWTCEGYLVGTRKSIYTEVPVLCWMGKIRGTSTLVFGLQDPLSNGGRGCWHPHWKTIHFKSQQSLKPFACS